MSTCGQDQQEGHKYKVVMNKSSQEFRPNLFIAMVVSMWPHGVIKVYSMDEFKRMLDKHKTENIIKGYGGVR